MGTKIKHYCEQIRYNILWCTIVKPLLHIFWSHCAPNEVMAVLWLKALLNSRTAQ